MRGRKSIMAACMLLLGAYEAAPSMGASATTQPNATGYFTPDAAQSDTMSVSGNVKVTGASASYSVAPLGQAEVSWDGSSATFTGRQPYTGAHYTLSGIWTGTGGDGGPGPVPTWTSEFYSNNKGSLSFSLSESAVAVGERVTATARIYNGSGEYAVTLGVKDPSPATQPVAAISFPLGPTMTVLANSATTRPVQGDGPGYATIEATCSNVAGSPATQPITVVGVDKVVANTTTPDPSAAALTVPGTAVAIEAKSMPSGVAFPSGKPNWTLTSQPTTQPADLYPTDLGSGNSVISFQKDRIGEYAVRAACGTSADDIPVFVCKTSFEIVGYSCGADSYTDPEHPWVSFIPGSVADVKANISPSAALPWMYPKSTNSGHVEVAVWVHGSSLMTLEGRDKGAANIEARVGSESGPSSGYMQGVTYRKTRKRVAVIIVQERSLDEQVVAVGPAVHPAGTICVRPGADNHLETVPKGDDQQTIETLPDGTVLQVINVGANGQCETTAVDSTMTDAVAMWPQGTTEAMQTHLADVYRQAGVFGWDLVVNTKTIDYDLDNDGKFWSGADSLHPELGAEWRRITDCRDTRFVDNVFVIANPTQSRSMAPGHNVCLLAVDNRTVAHELGHACFGLPDLYDNRDGTEGCHWVNGTMVHGTNCTDRDNLMSHGQWALRKAQWDAIANCADLQSY